MVADVLVIGWQADGHIEAEHILVVERHHALVGRTDRADRVRCAVPTDLELVGDIAIVVGGVHEREAVHRVIDAVGFDHVPETQLVTAPAGPIRDGGAVGHSVGADAFLDAFDRIGRRHGADLPGLRRIPVRGVHGRLHASLPGHLDVDPICALGPGIHAEITRRGQVVDHGVAAVGEADRLAHAARRRVGAAIVVHDRGAMQGLLDRRAAVVRVDGVADRHGRADLHVGLLAVRGGDGQRIIDGRLVLGQHDHTERGIGIGVDGILHQAIHRTHAKPIGPRGAGRVRLALVLVGATPLGSPLGLPTLARVRTDIGAAEHAVAEARVADGDHPAFRVTLPGVRGLALRDRVGKDGIHIHELVRPILQIGRQGGARITYRLLHAIQSGGPGILVDPMHVGGLRWNLPAGTATALAGTATATLGERGGRQTSQGQRPCGQGGHQHRAPALLPT